jgi:hypothetical protein
VPETIHVVWGQLENQSGEQAAPQTLLFPIETWTADEAKKWLADHDVKFISFEAATTEAAGSVALFLDLFGNIVGDLPAAPAQAEKWVQIALTGEWKGHPRGPYSLAPEDLRSIADFFNRRYVANRVDLVIDYEHQSLTVATSGERAPAAGWIDRLELRAGDTELWAHVRWNSAALDLMSRREYRYLSPVFRFNVPDPVTGEKRSAILDSLALTNRPFLTELPAIVNTGAKRRALVAQPPSAENKTTSAQSGAGGTPPPARATVPHEEDAGMALLKELAAALGMTPEAAAKDLGVAVDAGDADVLKPVASRLKAASASAAAAARTALFANALGVAQDADDKAIQAKADALTAPGLSLAVVANSLGVAPDAKPEELAKKIAELRGQAADTSAEKLVANAIEAKKIPPALKGWWEKQAKSDFAGTQAIVNALPAILSPASQTSGPGPNAQANPEQEFANSTALQEEFGEVQTYLAYRKAVADGRVKVVRKISEAA